MRTLCQVVLILGLAAVVLAPAVSQEGRRPFGQPGGGDPGRILLDPAVQKELKLTDEQLKKYQELMKKALADALTPEQAKRLKQIQLQQRGAEAFSDPEVATALKLTEDQKEKIQTIREDARKEMTDLFKNAAGNREEAFKKMAGMRKEIAEKVTAVLNAEQKKMWKEMLGEPFEGSGFRRPGGEKGKRPNKDN